MVLFAIRRQRGALLVGHGAIGKPVVLGAHGVGERRLDRIRDDDQQHQVVVGLEVADADLADASVRPQEYDADAQREQRESLGGKAGDGVAGHLVVMSLEADSTMRGWTWRNC